MASEEKLAAIETQLTGMGGDLAHIKRLIDRHDVILFGRNGQDDDNPGMIVEMDRLKQHRKDTEKTAFVVWATAIGLGLKTLWDMITKGH